jgi:hypothetical protein
MWNVEAKMIPIIIGATARLSRSFKKHLDATSGEFSSVQLQKTAIVEVARRFVECRINTNIKLALINGT